MRLRLNVTRYDARRHGTRAQTMLTCDQCGAAYSELSDDCSARFHALLALDHSRREPWGSRHGLAFSAYALQHPARYDREVLERAWVFLHAVYVLGRDRDDVARALRRGGKTTPRWDVPSLPTGAPAGRFEMTIADMRTFDQTAYGSLLDRWCQATLAAWSSSAAS